MKKIFYKVKRFEQTGKNCGPNSLAQLMSFFGDNKTPKEIIANTSMIKSIGTFDAHLGITAIKLGYKVKIITHNLYAFDPTWHKLSKTKLLLKLKAFSAGIKNKVLLNDVQAFISFLQLGGLIDFSPISKGLLTSILETHPVLAGLCSTYLYREKRFADWDNRFRYGHFVVINGYDPENDKFFITDPYHTIPFSKNGRYKVETDELIAAIYLGEATYDCTVMQIWR